MCAAFLVFLTILSAKPLLKNPQEIPNKQKTPQNKTQTNKKIPTQTKLRTAGLLASTTHLSACPCAAVQCTLHKCEQKTTTTSVTEVLPNSPSSFLVLNINTGEWEPLRLKTLECRKYFSIWFKECLTLLDTLKILLPKWQRALSIGHSANNNRNGRNGNRTMVQKELKFNCTHSCLSKCSN